MRKAAASARRWALWVSGLPGRLRFEALVLMYHRFSAGPDGVGLPRARFAEQLDYLGRHFAVVPLAEALAPARDHGRPRVALTVDDGYRSFHEHAWPELRARGLTATVFLPVQFVDDGGWMWQDRNIHLLRAAAPARHRCVWDGDELSLDLRHPAGLMAALVRVYQIGRRLDGAGRLELTTALSSCLGRELPASPPPHYAPLTWTQVRQLQDAGIGFGSHTIEHAILTTCGPQTARDEITRSRALLAERLGRDVDAFAYPNGDLDADVRAMVREAGYDVGLSTLPGYWSAGGDRFAVPRLPAPEGGAAVLADRLWCWWRAFGAPGPRFSSPPRPRG